MRWTAARWVTHPPALTVMVSVAGVALLSVFIALVQVSVEQGRSARAANAARDEALSHCQQVRDMQQRRECRLAL